jgi:D-tyrosyl-tRNA(Tyr) deacylase
MKEGLLRIVAARFGAGDAVIALLQRVLSASVSVEGATIAEISAGLLVFIGIKPTDVEADAARILSRLLKYRVFADVAGKMNLSLQHIGGSLLLVPQFTLAADTRSGSRPGFSTAAHPELGRRLYDVLVGQARALHPKVESGRFGAHMRVSLVNDGPVTFWLES